MKRLQRLFGTAGILALVMLCTAPLRADWCTKYYNNKTLSGSPDTLRTENTIDNDWGNGSPSGTGLGVDNFSVSWTTTITWDKNGKFTLRTNSDDGIRVYVDSVLVIDNWTDHGATYDYWTSATKSNGDTSTVVVQFYEAGGGAIAQLDWDRPGGGTNYVTVPNNRTSAPACSAPATPSSTATRTKTPVPGTATRTPTPVSATGPCAIQVEDGAEPAGIAEGSGGGHTYIYATASDTSGSGAYKDFPIYVPAAATYQMVGWANPADGSSDSWFIEMRNAASTATINDTAGYGADVWDIVPSVQHPAGYGNWGNDTVWGRKGTSNANAIRSWSLGVGSYTIRVRQREPNALLDCLSLQIAGAATATPTPVPTASPTATKTVWAGLPSSERLYGLEYIPFPADSANANSGISDLSLTKTSAASNNIGRNTARWRVVLKAMNTGTLAVETRLGPFGVTCTTGYFNPDNYDSATSLTLPDRPSNLSTTYAWLNKPVPPTERFDAVGDPRFVPYADVIGQPTSKNDLILGGYNWFFKNIADTGRADYEAEYVNALPEATRDRYNNQPNVDVPKLMLLWREGIMISRGIYNSLSGWSNYYIGLGGEVGGDSSNNLNNGVPAYGGPWNSGSTTYNVDEIIGTDGRGSTNVDGAVMLRNSGSWRGLPFLGELWPDNLYASDWCSNCSGGSSTWGNLRNPKQGGVSYRTEWQNAGINDNTTETHYQFSQIKHRNQDPGARSFMNGNDSSGTFDHWSVDYDANLLTDGTAIAQQLNFAMPAQFSVNRPWNLNGTGGLPSEWNEEPYKDRRTKLSLYPLGNNTGFYDSNSTGTTTQRASSALRSTASSIDNGGNTLVGFFVVSGLKPSTESGINFVARFSLLSCLRTFLDAGAPTVSAYGGGAANFGLNKIGSNTYRIQPPPLVQITEPYKGQSLAGYQNIILRWKERYARWDGDRYTEAYPCIDGDFSPCSANGVGGDPSLEWHDDAEIVFNIIYSMDGGGTWVSALSGDPAVPGVYMPGSDSVPYSSTHLYTYSWPVYGLYPGAKKVRVEAFRKNLALHYAYHEISIDTEP